MNFISQSLCCLNGNGLKFRFQFMAKHRAHARAPMRRHRNYCHRFTIRHTAGRFRSSAVGWTTSRQKKVTANLTLVRNFVSVPRSLLVGTCTPCCLLYLVFSGNIHGRGASTFCVSSCSFSPCYYNFFILFLLLLLGAK